MSRSQRSTLASSAIFLCSGALVCGPAWGQQPLDLTHSWVRSFPGTTGAQSFANGVAVLDSDTLADRGTVVVAGHADSNVMLLSFAAPPRGFVAFIPPDGDPNNNDYWLRHFADSPAPGSGAAACTGVSVGSRLTIPGRHAIVSGWFSGDIDFGIPVNPATTGRDAFIARLDQTGPGAGSTIWVATLRGTGDQEALAVSMGPPFWGGVGLVVDPVRYYARQTDLVAFAAVGGYFNQTIEFQPGMPIPSLGGDDAYIAIVQTTFPPGAVAASLRIGGISGNERINAVAVDHVDQGVLVAGSYSSASVNFNPNGAGVIAPPPAGSNDIFVARYCWTCLQQSGPGCNLWGLTLDWLYTTGTTGDDQALGVAVDVRGRAYATGYRHGGANGRDMWLAKIDQAPDCGLPISTTVSAWGPPSTGFVYSAPGDNIGRGITVDGLDRVLVTGQFAGTVDFDPSANVDNKTSAGGLDLFVTRLVQTYGATPSVQYDGTFRIGGSYDEAGSAVAIEGLRSQRFAHAGWFGAANSPNGYTVDFDPDSGIANKAGTGGADGFVSTFLPTITPPLDPSGIKAAVTLTLDTSSDVVDSPDYLKMMEAFLTHLPAAAVTPQDGKLALNAVMYDFDDGTFVPPDSCADQVLPWT